MFKSTAKALARLDDRLEKLTDGLIDLEREMRSLKLEWEETYDKIHRLFGRIAKRQAIDTPPLPGPPPVVETPDDGLDEISRAIIARRNSGKVA